MSWFILSILATVVFAAVNVVDKILLLRFAKTDITAVKVLGLFSLLVFLLLWPFGGRFLPSIQILYPFLAGVFEVAYIYWYLKAIDKEMLAFLVPFFSLAPIITLAVSLFLPYEIWPNFPSLVGMVLVIGGIILFVYSKEGFFRLPANRSIGFMLISATLFGVSSLFLDAGLDTLSVFDNLIWSRLGVFAGAVLIAYLVRQLHLRDINARTAVFAFSELLYLVTIYLFILALGLGVPTLVLGVGNIQPVFVFGLCLLLYKISPKILQEEFHFSLPSLAFFSLIIIAFGSWLMQIA